ncbi:MAG TPA: thermostable hemolysin [Gammaproteobacteria bacterium]|nr:thermostable hemolysin [Gammaproteobacteria bacterium]
MNFEPTAKIPTSSLRHSSLRAECLPKETPAKLICHSHESPQRQHVEEFVRNEFLIHFNARVKHFMPVLLALHGSRGDVRAVVGCRSAATERLFLETYTQEPIQMLLARRLGVDIARDQIAEIGSLACRSGRAAIDIVRVLIPFLLEAGFSWVVFTGADTVMNVFRHLKLAPRVLCTADQELLGDERHDWGTYYHHHPKVMAGRLREGIDVLDATARLQ